MPLLRGERGRQSANGGPGAKKLLPGGFKPLEKEGTTMTASRRVFLFSFFFYVIVGAGFVRESLADPAAAQEVAADETVTVEPAAVVTWDDLVRYGALAPTKLEQKTVPFMPVPEPLEISPPDIPLEISPPDILIPSEPTPLPEGQVGPLAPSLTTGFAALGDNNTTVPPDTMGAVGPSHMMTMLNSQVRIQNKTGGVISTVSLSAFWSSLTGSPFDPKVVYDSIHGRWIATCDANSRSSSSKVFFAISQTSDPTGTWNFYSFPADSGGTLWADYPGIGVNQTWIAITNNMYTVSGNSFSGVKMWVIDKAAALTGGSPTVSVFNTGFDNVSYGGNTYGGSTLKPCMTFGNQAKLYIVDNPGLSTGTALLQMSEISGTGPSPTWSVTAGSLWTGTGWFYVSNNFGSQINASQLGTAGRVMTNDSRMLNAVFRNGKIWCTHTGGLPVGSVDRTAVFWYQLDPALMASSGAPIVQSGVLDGGADVHHFFPGITANANNDACVGFSRSDSTRYVEAVATCRSAGDTAGTMAPITVVKAGEDSYIKDFGSGIRWGDYSATVVDPTDDLTFWTIQQYAVTDVGSTANDDRWGTWWGKFTQPVQYILTVNVAGLGSGTVTSDVGSINCPSTCQDIYNAGTSVQLTAAPGTCSTFNNWSGGYCSGPGNPCSLTMNANTTETSTFDMQAPTANFTGSPTSGNAPLAVNFTDSSTCNPTAWFWNFGDGSTSAQQNPSHTYISTGPYTISLKAYNAAGSNTLTQSNYITVMCTNNPVRSTPTSGSCPCTYYTTIQNAYTGASGGDYIECHGAATTFTENLTFNVSKTITLEGGFDCQYATLVSNTILNGNLTVSAGDVGIDYFTINGTMTVTGSGKLTIIAQTIIQ